MFKLQVPEIGTRLLLTEDWTFSLFWENRNLTLLKSLEEKKLIDETKFQPTNIEVLGWSWNYDGRNNSIQRYYNEYFKWSYNRVTGSYKFVKGSPYCYMMTMPKDSVIIIDRYYIRKGISDYSSITFRTEKLAFEGFKKKPRFWAKLADSNNINYKLLE